MLKKKITKLLVGTNNAGKLREIRDLLPKNLKIYSPRDLKIKSPVESGKTFVENKGNTLTLTTYMTDKTTKLENSLSIPNF